MPVLDTTSPSDLVPTLDSILTPPDEKPKNPYLDRLMSRPRLTQGPLDGTKRSLIDRFWVDHEQGYRQSFAGAGEAAVYSNLPGQFDPTNPMEMENRLRADRISQGQREYDAMAPSRTPLEATMAVAGFLSGAARSPEAFAALPTRFVTSGATALARTLRAGVSGAAVNVAIDPVVQGLRMEAGLQESYSPAQTAAAAAIGLALPAVVQGGLEAVRPRVEPPALRERVPDRLEPEVRGEASTKPTPEQFQELIDESAATLRAEADRDIAADVTPGFPERRLEQEPLPVPPVRDSLSDQITASEAQIIFRDENHGRLGLRTLPEAVQVLTAFVRDDLQGQGIGRRMHERAFEIAQSKNLPLWSDGIVRAGEARVFESMARRGYTVTRNPKAVQQDNGSWKASDYVYSVTAGPREQAPSTDVARDLVEQATRPTPPEAAPVDGAAIRRREFAEMNRQFDEKITALRGEIDTALAGEGILVARKGKRLITVTPSNRNPGKLQITSWSDGEPSGHIDTPADGSQLGRDAFDLAGPEWERLTGAEADRALLMERLPEPDLTDDRAGLEQMLGGEVGRPELADDQAGTGDRLQSADTGPTGPNLERIPAFSEEIPPTPGQRAGIFIFDPREIAVDAKTFQFKGGADTEGVTPILRGVTKWSPEAAGQIIVWQNTAGKLFVADGHQRVALAKKLLETGAETDIDLPGSLFRETDGFSAEAVMVRAALKNIREGSGDVMDAAKILRLRPDQRDQIAEIGRTQTRQAVALTRLSDEVYRMAINGVIEPRDAAVIGRILANDEPMQEAAARLLARVRPASEAEAEILVRRVRDSGLVKAEEGSQGGLFGADAPESLVAEEIRIVAHATKLLASDRTIMRRVVANAERIEQTGSRIERGAATEAATEAGELSRLIESVAFTRGPARDRLLEVARGLKDGSITLAGATESFVEAVRLGARPGDPGGIAVGRGGSSDAAQGEGALAAGSEAEGVDSAVFGMRLPTGASMTGAPGALTLRMPSGARKLLEEEGFHPTAGSKKSAGGTHADWEHPDGRTARVSYHLLSKTAQHSQGGAAVWGYIVKIDGLPKATGMRLPGEMTLADIEARVDALEGELAADPKNPALKKEMTRLIDAHSIRVTQAGFGRDPDKGVQVEAGGPGVARGEAGQALSKEERKTVLATLVDVYKASGLQKELKGVSRSGEEQWGYPYTPDLFRKSDITGAMVRYHVSLPDGRVAHPTELFPNYTQSDIDAEVRRRVSQAREVRLQVKDLTKEDQQFGSVAEATTYWDRRSEDSKKQSSGGWALFHPASMRTTFAKGDKFVLIADSKLEQGEIIEELAEQGWTHATPDKAPTVEPGAEGLPQTVIPGAERATDATIAQRRADQPLRPKATQKGDVGPLFGDSDKQKELFGFVGFRKGKPPLLGELDRSSTGVAAGQGPAAERLKDISERLVDALGLTVRQGRITLRGAQGTFNRATGVTRLKEIDAYDILVHEGGHALHLEPQNKVAIDGLIAAHAADIERLAYAGSKPGTERVEGFAEWFRLWLTNPLFAAKEAPNFTADFTRWMETNRNEQFQALLEAQSAYRDWLQAPSRDMVVGDLVTSAKPPLPPRLAKALGPDRLPTGESLFSFFDRFYTWTIDTTHPLRRGVNALLDIAHRNTGQRIELKANEDAYKLARLATNAYQAGHIDLSHGVVPYRGLDPQGPSFAEALELAAGKNWFGNWRSDDLLDFGGYLVARRSIVEFQRFLAGEVPNPPGKLTLGDYRQAVADFEGAHPNFAPAASLLYQYQTNNLRKKFEAGLVSRSFYDAALAKADYVPFQRDFSEKIDEILSAGTGGTNRQSVMKTYRGSLRSIINPIESIISDAYDTAAIIARNDVVNALDDMAARAGYGSGAIAERIPSHQMKPVSVDIVEALRAAGKDAGLLRQDVDSLIQQAEDALGEDNLRATLFRAGEAPDKGEPIVYGWKGGERYALRLADGRFGKELFRALTQIGNEQSNWVINMLAIPARGLRAGITTSPEFLIANYLRDQISAFVLNTRFVPLLSGARGAYDELRQGRHARLYAQAGGVMGGANVASLDQARIGRSIAALQKKGYNFRRMKDLREVIKFTEVSETGTRIALFRQYFNQARKNGLTEYEALVEGAFQARDYMDFGRHGSKMLTMRRLVTFFNAALQGTDKTLRVLVGDLKPMARVFRGETLTRGERQNLARSVSAWAKISALTALSATYAAMYRDDPEFQEASEYLRATHWLFKLPGGEWATIPKPYEMSVIMNLGERAAEGLMADDPTWAERWVRSWAFSLTPPLEPAGLMVPAEIMFNYDTFRDRPIVPQLDLGKEPALQFNNYTSEFSKALGKAINVSPAKIDHLIVGWAGSWGRNILASSNAAIDPARRSSELYDWPITGRFVKNLSRGSDATDKFYGLVSETGGRLELKNNTFRAMQDRGQENEAQAYYDGLRDDEKAWVALNAQDKADNKRLHPLRRASDVAGVLSGMRREILGRNVVGIVSKQPITVNPTMASAINDQIARVSAAEVRNAMIAVGEPGWAQRQVMDVDQYYDAIKKLSPEVAGEIEARLRKVKVLPFDGVRSVWPELRDRLLKDGPEAFVSDLRGDAMSAGRSRRQSVPVGPDPFAGVSLRM